MYLPAYRSYSWNLCHTNNWPNTNFKRPQLFSGLKVLGKKSAKCTNKKRLKITTLGLSVDVSNNQLDEETTCKDM